MRRTDPACILAISPFLWTMKWGSGVPTLYRTLEAWASRGANIHVVLPGTASGIRKANGITMHVFRLAGWCARLDFGPERSIFSHVLPGGRLGRYLLDKLLFVQFLIQASWFTVRLARSLRPDVFYGVTPYGAPVAWLLRRIFGGLNVTRLLGTFLCDVTRFGPGVVEWFRKVAWLAPHATEVLAFRIPSSAIVVTDDGTKGREVGAALGRRDVQCWRNGIALPDEADLRRRSEYRARLGERFGIAPGATVGIYAGQLVRWKRVDRIVSASALLRDGRKTVILIAGDGPERPGLEELARRTQVLDRLRFCGAKTHEELHELWMGADYFICTHDLTCACNSTFEAMAAELPVIVTPFGDTGAFVTDGQEGVVLGEASESSIAAAIEFTSEHAEIRLRWGRQARRRIALTLGTWRERADRELDFILSAQAPKRHGARLKVAWGGGSGERERTG